MKKWYKYCALGAVCLFCLLSLYKINSHNEPASQDMDIIYQENNDIQTMPVVFMQYFDWYFEDTWIESNFTDKLLWEELGITGSDRESEDFYYKQFQYIKSLGVDALAWEYHPRKGGAEPLYPTQNAINALKKSGLKIAPFFDFEVALKVLKDEEMRAVLSNGGMIRPDKDTADYMVQQLNNFYERVPEELWACDGKGRTVVYVFGYDFNDDSEPSDWNNFANLLVGNVKEFVGNEPAFYWTYKNSSFAEHLFLNHSNNFIPFQFVLDTPQGQFGHDSVTWNVGFDNLDVQIRDGLERVIRLDERYIKEMGWLASATEPAAVFIYGWNEPFEGSIVMPTERWGDTKAKLIKSYIERLKNGDSKKLKDVLLIVDNLDKYYLNDKMDWHYVIERELLLYPMRRFLPQSDVCTTDMLTEELMDKYSCIVDISVDKSENQRKWLLDRMNEKQIVCVDPKAMYVDASLIEYFAEPIEAMNINGEVQLLGTIFEKTSKIFLRDDMIKVASLNPNSDKILESFVAGKKNPVVIVNEDDIYVNAYTDDERILKKVFETFYGIELKKSILYGEGYASQRLEIDNWGGATKEKHIGALFYKSILGDSRRNFVGYYASVCG